MSKILIEGNKVIIDGHASDLETCNTLTNLCDELSTSEKFRTVKYESGYGEFESVSENEEKKFPPMTTLVIYSNDGTRKLYESDVTALSDIGVTSTGLLINFSSAYTYDGDKIFLGFSNAANSTSPTFPVGYSGTLSIMGMSSNPVFFIVEADPPSFQVNIQSNDGTTTLAQNATVDSVVVTATGAQLKYGNTVKITYTYSGSKLFAGLATSANATTPTYKPGDTIEITANTTLYIVENIIIPDHHSSLTELFTNIAAVIREKTGDTALIIADDFPSVIRERLQVIPHPPTYLTFSSPNSFTLKVKDTTKHWNGTLEYSTDTSTWSTWDGTTTLSSTTSGSDNVLYLRGIGNTKIIGASTTGYRWVLTGSDIKCTGNIESILDYEIVNSGSHPSMENYCYHGMFYGCTALTQAPALPATTLTNECYRQMFEGCTSLTQAPSLPATTATDNCYYSMFRDCTNLTNAPALPATTLIRFCYNSMFFGCTSLTQAPALPATTLANNCYGNMFRDCTALTQAPDLPATTLAPECYLGMFQGCTSLTKAPDLPATTLASNCYLTMFYSCTSLTHAPALPAMTLANYCYKNMFSRCTSLTQAPDLPATTLASNCYYSMFRDCTNLTNAPALPATTLAEYCYQEMFYNCTSLTQAPELPATTLAYSCYRGMFNRCRNLTKTPSELPATKLEIDCYRFMFEFTAITAIPRIMATTYIMDSCKGMFDDIKTLNVYSRSGPGHTYGWTAPTSVSCSGMFGSDDGESEWAKLDGSNFPNSGTPTEGVTYYFATVD